MKASTHALRRYRNETGRTLGELAAKVGTTKAWLSRIERGEQASPDLMRKLIAETGLSADDLLQSAEAAE
jgi:transcriptional regulator with XRE-family HTH domain